MNAAFLAFPDRSLVERWVRTIHIREPEFFRHQMIFLNVTTQKYYLNKTCTRVNICLGYNLTSCEAWWFKFVGGVKLKIYYVAYLQLIYNMYPISEKCV
jgi:hypothetical protein